MASVGHFLGRVGREIADSGTSMKRAENISTKLWRDDIISAPTKARKAIDRGTKAVRETAQDVVWNTGERWHGFLDDIERGFTKRPMRSQERAQNVATAAVDAYRQGRLATNAGSEFPMLATEKQHYLAARTSAEEVAGRSLTGTERAEIRERVHDQRQKLAFQGRRPGPYRGAQQELSDAFLKEGVTLDPKKLNPAVVEKAQVPGQRNLPSNQPTEPAYHWADDLGQTIMRHPVATGAIALGGIGTISYLNNRRRGGDNRYLYQY